MHDILGRAGIARDRVNRFGENALAGDVACEETVINSLLKSSLRFRVISEEHGTLDLAEDPEYLAVLDGIDGSAEYVSGVGARRYGTLLGIFAGTDPTYDDYIACGFMEHSTKRIYFAVKGEGAFLVDPVRTAGIRTSGKTELDMDANIYVDECYEHNRMTFSEPLAQFLPNRKAFYGGISAAVHFADVASGKADLNLRCSGKNNLEPAVCYGLITEAGGVMVDAEGNSLGSKKYLTFGQNEQIPIITAATPELASNLIVFLKKP